MLFFGYDFRNRKHTACCNAGFDFAACVDASPVSLTGSPAGGTYSGDGISGSQFNPAVAGAGTHTIIYSYTDVNGCSNSDSATVTVNALPVVNAGLDFALCVNAAPLSLSGSPAGGNFSGAGVSGSSFNPGTAGGGTHTVGYTYTDLKGCVNSDTATPAV